MNSALPWQRLLMVPCTAVVFASLQPLDPPAKAHSLNVSTPTQLNHSPRPALFRAQREWELNSFDRRRAMWREERRCIRRASSRWALQRCKDDYARALNNLERDRRRAMDRARRRFGRTAGRPVWGSGHGSNVSWRDQRHGHPHRHNGHSHRSQPTIRVDWRR